MSRPAGALAATCLALALAGCTNPDVQSAGHGGEPERAPANAGEPAAPLAPPPASEAPAGVQATPELALAAFAGRYVNWSYRTLAAEQRTLAAISVGAARLAEQQAAASTQADSAIARARIENRGAVLSIARDLSASDRWVVVTREQTAGSGEYEGLPASYHVSLATLAKVPGGYAVTRWQPQS